MGGTSADATSRRRASRSALAGAIVAALMLATATGAQALTMGSTSSTGLSNCIAGDVLTNTASATPSYTVPSSGGVIDQWSIDTTGATAGTPIDFVVVHQSAGGSGSTLTVDGFDDETVPNPLPSNHVATFTPASPIYAPPGDLIGLYSSTNTVGCYYNGATPADTVEAASGPSPSPGATYAFSASAANLRINLTADLITNADVSLAQTITPASVTSGGLAVMQIKVSNAGPARADATVSDGVPAGLSIVDAVAGMGSCSTSGQNVSCTITSLPAGSSTNVDIAVVTGAAGTFTNTATAALSQPDPNPANNTASASLKVTTPPATPATSTPAPLAPVPAPCRVLALARIPLAFSESVLRALDCQVGRVTSAHSSKVAKGSVIKTTPGPGQYKAGTKVNIVKSSGPARKKKKH